MHRDPRDVIHELVVLSNELFRLGDTGQDPPPSLACAALRTRRDLVQAEMRVQLRLASGLAGSERPPSADRENAATVPPPPRSLTHLRAIARPADTPNPARARRKEGP